MPLKAMKYGSGYTKKNSQKIANEIEGYYVGKILIVYQLEEIIS